MQSNPSRSTIQRTLDTGTCYVAIVNSGIVGVFVLIQTRKKVSEITHLATRNNSKDVTLALIARAIDKAKASNSEILEAGVSNSSIKKLELFQKYGFRITGIVHDHYLQSHKQKIIENGILCRDLLKLTLDLR